MGKKCLPMNFPPKCFTFIFRVSHTEVWWFQLPLIAVCLFSAQQPVWLDLSLEEEMWCGYGTAHLLQAQHAFKNPPVHVPATFMTLETHSLKRLDFNVDTTFTQDLGVTEVLDRALSGECKSGLD